MLQTVHLVSCFSHDQTGVTVLGEENSEASSSHTGGMTTTMSLITGSGHEVQRVALLCKAGLMADEAVPEPSS